jgi:hypothetical protein
LGFLGNIFRHSTGYVFQSCAERLAEKNREGGRARRGGRAGKRRVIRPAILLTVLLTCSVLADNQQHSRVGNPRNYEVDILVDTFGFSQEDIDVDIDQVFQGCAGRDCIPSIDQPQFIPADKVDFLDPDDLVLSLTHAGESRAYPTRILDRHEIVNDRFGSTPIAVTYCPLCGSGLAFVREVGGVSGFLSGEEIPVHRMFWFAWFSFHPTTSLIDERNH